MSLVLQSSGGGQITIQEPATASNFTQTLPAASGEVMVSGNMPAFSAYNSGYQTITTATWTKLNADTENFDTNNNFASSRFTPTVAGYYQFNSNVITSASAVGSVGCAVYKNGTKAFTGTFIPNSAQAPTPAVSALLYANGSTDYFELYFYQNSGSNMTAGLGDSSSGFSGSMVRSA